MQVTGNLLRNYHTVVIAIFGDLWRCTANDEFPEAVMIKIFSNALHHHAGKVVLIPKNAACAYIVLRCSYIGIGPYFLEVETIFVQNRGIVRRIGALGFYVDMSAEIGHPQFDGFLGAESYRNCEQGDDDAESYRKPADKDDNP